MYLDKWISLDELVEVVDADIQWGLFSSLQSLVRDGYIVGERLSQYIFENAGDVDKIILSEVIDYYRERASEQSDDVFNFFDMRGRCFLSDDSHVIDLGLLKKYLEEYDPYSSFDVYGSSPGLLYDEIKFVRELDIIISPMIDALESQHIDSDQFEGYLDMLEAIKDKVDSAESSLRDIYGRSAMRHFCNEQDDELIYLLEIIFCKYGKDDS